MKICPQCRTNYGDEDVFCQICGSQLMNFHSEEERLSKPSAPEKDKSAQRTCSQCGLIYPEGCAFCEQCGIRLGPAGAAGEPFQPETPFTQPPELSYDAPAEEEYIPPENVSYTSPPLIQPASYTPQPPPQQREVLQKSSRQNTMFILVIGLAALLLIAIIFMMFLLFRPEKDNQQDRQPDGGLVIEMETTMVTTEAPALKTEFEFVENTATEAPAVRTVRTEPATTAKTTKPAATVIVTTTVQKITSAAVTTTVTTQAAEIPERFPEYGESGISNILNGGYAVRDEDYVYFSDESGLYRYNGSESMHLTDFRTYYLNEQDDYLYFTNANEGNMICRMKKDGSGYEVLLDAYCYELTLYDGWLYFSTDVSGSRAISRMKPDGSELTSLVQTTVWYMCILEDTIFYCDYDNDYKLCAVNTDGSNQRVLFEGECSDLCAANGRIYFSADRTSRQLCSMNLDGSGFLMEASAYAKHTNYMNGRLFFISDDSKLYTCVPGTSQVELYADVEMTYPVLLPGMIFFEDENGIVYQYTTNE